VHGLAPQNFSPDKRVDVRADNDEDRGSTPLASIFPIQVSQNHSHFSISTSKTPASVVAILGRISERKNVMATYISLVQFTDQGIRAAKETTQRVAEWAAKVQSMGISIKQMYWTLGQYDQVCVFNAPDDETAASVLLSADMLGNIRTQTLRAFTGAEMEKILAKIA
jgi:uncharacterized protein with GYD domain